MNFCHTPQVALSIKYLNPFITLLLPTILIVFADVVSFALPLGGGERNSFKVTLVLSFTMFLIILNDELPGDSQCSPIIRQSARTHTHTQNTQTMYTSSITVRATNFNVCLCRRNPLLCLSDPLGAEHVGVHGAHAVGQRWQHHILLLYQRVSPRKQGRERG